MREAQTIIFATHPADNHQVRFRFDPRECRFKADEVDGWYHAIDVFYPENGWTVYALTTDGYRVLALDGKPRSLAEQAFCRMDMSQDRIGVDLEQVTQEAIDGD